MNGHSTRGSSGHATGYRRRRRTEKTSSRLLVRALGDSRSFARASHETQGGSRGHLGAHRASGAHYEVGWNTWGRRPSATRVHLIRLSSPNRRSETTPDNPNARPWFTPVQGLLAVRHELHLHVPRLLGVVTNVASPIGGEARQSTRLSSSPPLWAAASVRRNNRSHVRRETPGRKDFGT
jgi:hypothetical protein